MRALKATVLVLVVLVGCALAQQNNDGTAAASQQNNPNNMPVCNGDRVCDKGEDIFTCGEECAACMKLSNPLEALFLHPAVRGLLTQCAVVQRQFMGLAMSNPQCAQLFMMFNHDGEPPRAAMCGNPCLQATMNTMQAVAACQSAAQELFQHLLGGGDDSEGDSNCNYNGYVDQAGDGNCVCHDGYTGMYCENMIPRRLYSAAVSSYKRNGVSDSKLRALISEVRGVVRRRMQEEGDDSHAAGGGVEDDHEEDREEDDYSDGDGDNRGGDDDQFNLQLFCARSLNGQYCLDTAPYNMMMQDDHDDDGDDDGHDGQHAGSPRRLLRLLQQDDGDSDADSDDLSNMTPEQLAQICAAIVAQPCCSAQMAEHLPQLAMLKQAGCPDIVLHDPSCELPQWIPGSCMHEARDVASTCGWSGDEGDSQDSEGDMRRLQTTGSPADGSGTSSGSSSDSPMPGRNNNDGMLTCDATCAPAWATFQTCFEAADNHNISASDAQLYNCLNGICSDPEAGGSCNAGAASCQAQLDTVRPLLLSNASCAMAYTAILDGATPGVCNRPCGSEVAMLVAQERACQDGTLEQNGAIRHFDGICGCGDGMCSAFEDHMNCPLDCGDCRLCNHDLQCDAFESPETCPQDCGRCSFSDPGRNNFDVCTSLYLELHAFAASADCGAWLRNSGLAPADLFNGGSDDHGDHDDMDGGHGDHGDHGDDGDDDMDGSGGGQSADPLMMLFTHPGALQAFCHVDNVCARKYWNMIAVMNRQCGDDDDKSDDNGGDDGSDGDFHDGGDGSGNDYRRLKSLRWSDIITPAVLKAAHMRDAVLTGSAKASQVASAAKISKEMESQLGFNQHRRLSGDEGDEGSEGGEGSESVQAGVPMPASGRNYQQMTDFSAPMLAASGNQWGFISVMLTNGTWTIFLTSEEADYALYVTTNQTLAMTGSYEDFEFWATSIRAHDFVNVMPQVAELRYYVAIRPMLITSNSAAYLTIVEQNDNNDHGSEGSEGSEGGDDGDDGDNDGGDGGDGDDGDDDDGGDGGDFPTYDQVCSRGENGQLCFPRIMMLFANPSGITCQSLRALGCCATVHENVVQLVRLYQQFGLCDIDPDRLSARCGAPDWMPLQCRGVLFNASAVCDYSARNFTCGRDMGMHAECAAATVAVTDCISDHSDMLSAEAEQDIHCVSGVCTSADGAQPAGCADRNNDCDSARYLADATRRNSACGVLAEAWDTEKNMMRAVPRDMQREVCTAAQRCPEVVWHLHALQTQCPTDQIDWERPMQFSNAAFSVYCSCGDGRCGEGENGMNCPEDCLGCAVGICDNNGRCDKTESPDSCPDCAACGSEERDERETELWELQCATATAIATGQPSALRYLGSCADSYADFQMLAAGTMTGQWPADRASTCSDSCMEIFMNAAEQATYCAHSDEELLKLSTLVLNLPASTLEMAMGMATARLEASQHGGGGGDGGDGDDSDGGHFHGQDGERRLAVLVRRLQQAGDDHLAGDGKVGDHGDGDHHDGDYHDGGDDHDDGDNNGDNFDRTQFLFTVVASLFRNVCARNTQGVYCDTTVMNIMPASFDVDFTCQNVPDLNDCCAVTYRRAHDRIFSSLFNTELPSCPGLENSCQFPSWVPASCLPDVLAAQQSCQFGSDSFTCTPACNAVLAPAIACVQQTAASLAPADNAMLNCFSSTCASALESGQPETGSCDDRCRPTLQTVLLVENAQCNATMALIRAASRGVELSRMQRDMVCSGACSGAAWGAVAESVNRGCTPRIRYDVICGCGNGVCGLGEDADSCPEDCDSCTGCNHDGVCNMGEDVHNCYDDCGGCHGFDDGFCGDKFCSVYEDAQSCATDCAVCKPRCNQDGVCGMGEDAFSCPTDCGQCGDNLYPNQPSFCGNGACDADEDLLSCGFDCTADCAYVGCNSDGICNLGEDYMNCPLDCGSCAPHNGDEQCDYAGVLEEDGTCKCFDGFMGEHCEQQGHGDGGDGGDSDGGEGKDDSCSKYSDRIAELMMLADCQALSNMLPAAGSRASDAACDNLCLIPLMHAKRALAACEAGEAGDVQEPDIQLLCPRSTQGAALCPTATPEGGFSCEMAQAQPCCVPPAVASQLARNGCQLPDVECDYVWWMPRQCLGQWRVARLQCHSLDDVINFRCASRGSGDCGTRMGMLQQCLLGAGIDTTNPLLDGKVDEVMCVGGQCGSNPDRSCLTQLYGDDDKDDDASSVSDNNNNNNNNNDAPTDRVEDEKFSFCGDGVCDRSEGQFNCPADCKGCALRTCNDNGICEDSESRDSCFGDCGGCGDIAGSVSAYLAACRLAEDRLTELASNPQCADMMSTLRALSNRGIDESAPASTPMQLRAVCGSSCLEDFERWSMIAQSCEVARPAGLNLRALNVTVLAQLWRAGARAQQAADQADSPMPMPAMDGAGDDPVSVTRLLCQRDSDSGQFCLAMPAFAAGADSFAAACGALDAAPCCSRVAEGIFKHAFPSSQLCAHNPGRDGTNNGRNCLVLSGGNGYLTDNCAAAVYKAQQACDFTTERFTCGTEDSHAACKQLLSEARQCIESSPAQLRLVDDLRVQCYDNVCNGVEGQDCNVAGGRCGAAVEADLAGDAQCVVAVDQLKNLLMGDADASAVRSPLCSNPCRNRATAAMLAHGCLAPEQLGFIDRACAVCGDGTCSAGEGRDTCPADCTFCSINICNRNNECEVGENPQNCPSDCGRCDAPEQVFFEDADEAAPSECSGLTGTEQNGQPSCAAISACWRDVSADCAAVVDAKDALNIESVRRSLCTNPCAARAGPQLAAAGCLGGNGLSHVQNLAQECACGDGYCSSEESPASCAADCSACGEIGARALRLGATEWIDVDSTSLAFARFDVPEGLPAPMLRITATRGRLAVYANSGDEGAGALPTYGMHGRKAMLVAESAMSVAMMNVTGAGIRLAFNSTRAGGATIAVQVYSAGNNPVACGNLMCDEGETVDNCPGDCFFCGPKDGADSSTTATAVCGDGVCSASESPASCGTDCGERCADPTSVDDSASQDALCGTLNAQLSTTLNAAGCDATRTMVSAFDASGLSTTSTAACSADCLADYLRQAKSVVDNGCWSADAPIRQESLARLAWACQTTPDSSDDETCGQKVAAVADASCDSLAGLGCCLAGLPGATAADRVKAASCGVDLISCMLSETLAEQLDDADTLAATRSSVACSAARSAAADWVAAAPSQCGMAFNATMRVLRAGLSLGQAATPAMAAELCSNPCFSEAKRAVLAVASQDGCMQGVTSLAAARALLNVACLPNERSGNVCLADVQGMLASPSDCEQWQAAGCCASRLAAAVDTLTLPDGCTTQDSCERAVCSEPLAAVAAATNGDSCADVRSALAALTSDTAARSIAGLNALCVNDACFADYLAAADAAAAAGCMAPAAVQNVRSRVAALCANTDGMDAAAGDERCGAEALGVVYDLAQRGAEPTCDQVRSIGCCASTLASAGLVPTAVIASLRDRYVACWEPFACGVDRCTATKAAIRSACGVSTDVNPLATAAGFGGTCTLDCRTALENAPASCGFSTNANFNIALQRCRQCDPLVEAAAAACPGLSLADGTAPATCELSCAEAWTDAKTCVARSGITLPAAFSAFSTACDASLAQSQESCLSSFQTNNAGWNLAACARSNPTDGCASGCQKALSQLIAFCSNSGRHNEWGQEETARWQTITEDNGCQFSSTLLEWVRGEFGSCSVACGGGVRERSVTCVNALGEEALGCNPDDKPVTSITCNRQECTTYSWLASGIYGVCSNICGGGTQDMLYRCVDNNGNGVDSSFCDPTTKPSESRDCNTDACPEEEIVFYTWTGTAFSECSGSCDAGFELQTRDAWCVRVGNTIERVDNALCNAAERPALTQPCPRPEVCYSYRLGPYRARDCEGGCGLRTQRRIVTCVVTRANGVVEALGSLRLCRAALGEPEGATRACPLVRCTRYQWRAGPWDECSAPCTMPGGPQPTSSRTVECKDQNQLAADGDFMTVDGSNCDAQIPAPVQPVSTRSCNVKLCVSYRWYADEAFSACSDADNNCDGAQTRTVRCERVDSDGVQTVDDGECPAAARPVDSIDCQPCNKCGDVVCLNGGTCNPVSALCENCEGGFTGSFCEIPPACDPAVECCDNTVPDRNGDCCAKEDIDGCGICFGSAFTVNGECCENGVEALVSASGTDTTCCTQAVDKCGVCGGSGVRDANNACCDESALAADLLCCEGNDDNGVPLQVDSCGVCGGNDACKVKADLQVAVDPAVAAAAAGGAGSDDPVVRPVLNSMEDELASALGLDSEAVTACLQSDDDCGSSGGEGGEGSEGSESGRRLASRRRRLQDGSDSLEVTLLVEPSADGDVLDTSDELASQLEDPSSALLQSPTMSQTVPDSTQVGLAGSCGNQQCEVGEDNSNCPEDCVFAAATCVNDCNGHGSCSATGVCSCFPGWTSTATCGGCREGTTQVGETCLDMTLLSSLIADAQPEQPDTPGEGGDGSEGGDGGDGGNNGTDTNTLPLTDFFGQYGIGVIAGGALVVIIVAVVVIRWRQGSKADDEAAKKAAAASAGGSKKAATVEEGHVYAVKDGKLVEMGVVKGDSA